MADQPTFTWKHRIPNDGRAPTFSSDTTERVRKMIPTVNAEKTKQRITTRTVVGTIVWFVLLAAVLVVIAFGGHL